MTDQPTNQNPTDEVFDESLLSAYLDQELTASERSLVESRLSEDASLRKVFEDLQQVRQWIISNPSEAGITKPIQGEWDRQPGATVASVLMATATTDNALADSTVNAETHISSKMKSGFPSRSWWSLGSLAASLLAIVSGIYLLPSVLRSPSSELAKSVPTKVSPAIADDFQSPQSPSLNRSPSPASNPNLQPNASQVPSVNLSPQASQVASAPAPKQLAPGIGRSMDATTNFYSLQDAEAVKLAELPKTTVFIQARRSGQVQLNMQYQQNLAVSDNARVQANSSSSLPPASANSPTVSQSEGNVLRSEVDDALPMIATSDAKAASESTLQAAAKDKELKPNSESKANLNEPSSAMGATQLSTPDQGSSDQDIIEAVMPRSQIAFFLNENQLDKLVEDEISPTKPERNAYVQDRLSRQRSGRSVQQYFGNGTQQIAPTELSQKMDNKSLRKNQEMQSAEIQNRDSVSRARMVDGTAGSLSNVQSKSLDSTDSIKPTELGINDDWVHVVIEVVP
jgi:hypothetical protein